MYPNPIVSWGFPASVPLSISLNTTSKCFWTGQSSDRTWRTTSSLDIHTKSTRLVHPSRTSQTAISVSGSNETGPMQSNNADYIALEHIHSTALSSFSPFTREAIPHLPSKWAGDGTHLQLHAPSGPQRNLRQPNYPAGQSQPPGIVNLALCRPVQPTAH